MEPLSATIIARDEERNIAGALESLSWVDEIVVIDSGSTDKTVEICRKYTDRVFHKDWSGYVDQKNYAVERCRYDWIFSLDADERAGPELQSEIMKLRSQGFREAGYRIPRVTCFMGRWIRHGDWYPDYQLRLFDRRRGRWEGGRVHESVKIRGEAGMLSGEIQHFTYRRLSDYLRRLETYSSLAAAEYHQKGRRFSSLGLMANPFLAFLRGYVCKRGFLDGTPGLMVAVMGAISVYFKYAKLFEIQHSRPGESEADRLLEIPAGPGLQKPGVGRQKPG